MRSPDIDLTSEQLAVVECPARVVVVGACPGSGKTRVFVESLRQRLSKYAGQRRRGVAALSFTNVAQEEIVRRLGSTPGHPHFVGTLDAFMLRYVVRPFGHLIGLCAEGIELIPSPLNELIERPSIRVGPNAYDKVSIFRAHACGGSLQDPVFSYRHQFANKELDGDYADRVLRSKWNQWRSRGRVTHSDCQYLAAAILTHPEHGPKVRGLLCRRFPEILIDEFQDTGWFLGKAVLSILGHPEVMGLVVGDPNQAIYEFSGSNPDLFTEAAAIEGATYLSLSISHRCPRKVAAIASDLSCDQATISAREDAEDGRTVLVLHDLADLELSDQMVAQIERIHHTGDQLAILARKSSWVRKLAGIAGATANKVVPVGQRFDRAVQHLHSGDAAAAAKLVGSVLGDLLLDEPSPSTDDLNAMKIGRMAWRLAQYSVLKEAERTVEGESWNNWLVRCKEAVKDTGIKLGCTMDARRIGSTFKTRRDKFGDHERVAQKAGLPDSRGKSLRNLKSQLSTVHKVKGAEFDTVMLVIPKPHQGHAKCPSDQWWPISADYEERRIAFVAATRAKKTFALCVHRETYRRLQKHRPAFLALFDEVFELEGGPVVPKAER